MYLQANAKMLLFAGNNRILRGLISSLLKKKDLISLPQSNAMARWQALSRAHTHSSFGFWPSGRTGGGREVIVTKPVSIHPLRPSGPP